MATYQLVKSIDAAIESLAQEPPSDVDRLQLLAASKRLQEASESPFDSIISIGIGPYIFSAVRAAIDMGIFSVLISTKEGGITALELAEKTKSDEVLVTRIMRFVTGIGFAKELGVCHYAPTPKTGLLAPGSPFVDGIQHAGLVLQGLAKLPQYFREHGFKNPTSSTDSPFTWAINFKGTLFDFLKDNPEEQGAFNRVMRHTRLERGEEWFDFFPTEARLGSTDPNSVLLVDIGGGIGHDLAAFHARFPSLPGRLIVQDLAAAIDDIKEADLPPVIERQVYDFFTPQPVKGARAYYMRHVLHDHPDQAALEILRHVRDAMTSESVLLVNEDFIPATGAALHNAGFDLTMMVLFSAMDRTQKHWITLIESAGFSVVKVWSPKIQVAASGLLFEAIKKD